ncbi:MAG: Hsp20/alpha crystallin family protein [cyanobacterium endosymbiont of Rhopalodia musculus]|uniref:Hsp20/alpha crystallin family protein n=1 Tax=cyanobacterium endosymbiont of Epithemia clementina EcSB TaxID=3034674 RepID=UPI00248098B3|nr:Hsp20/alpha crystallin family protein [cyanobacterium endosymbiont of Epithemia clementina EcSB]WGT67625.1 Hsp20/alpha crystallin family protein [cyanobacterium endosymbiont of Epithemia clementina EcSB]
MALIRYSNNRELDTLQRQMNRLFDDIFSPTLERNMRGSASVPAAELSETDEAVLLKLEIPGMKAEDLDIQVTKEAVYIKGERKQEVVSQDKGITQSEFRYGKFERAIALSSLVDNANVTAEYKDGILHLTIPKAEDEKNKVVKVTLS